ncbi:DUF7108 family protein [Natronomonas sp.]|uniref:DUF7108 family protein n=1 Tax=Natronomonas sp. TaxID=2184060 RepID=UPI002610CCCF|nr:rnhA operon protein [Natronomonas sp.]
MAETNRPPPDAIDRAVRLTRRARSATDESEREAYLEDRSALLSEYSYAARTRSDGGGETLILYPTEWLEDGTVVLEAVTDTDRAIERSLSGPGTGDDWGEIDEHNRAVARTVRERHGDVHGDTADAFATFMSNHYAKPIEAATPGERDEFRTEYFRRNAWPSDEQRAELDRSVELVLDAARARRGSDG